MHTCLTPGWCSAWAVVWNRVAVISPKFDRAKLVLKGRFYGLGGILDLRMVVIYSHLPEINYSLKLLQVTKLTSYFIVFHMKLQLRKFVFAWVKMGSMRLRVLIIFLSCWLTWDEERNNASDCEFDRAVWCVKEAQSTCALLMWVSQLVSHCILVISSFRTN